MAPNTAPDTDFIAAAKTNWEKHGWGDAASGMATLTSVVRVAQMMRTRCEQTLAPFGISFARYELLTLLHFTRHGALPMSKISERLQVHPASVTHTVARLERDGLVRRGSSAEDKRVILVSITDQGIALVKAATPELNAVFRNLGLTADAQEDLYQICSDFRRIAGDF